jgi:hypothetical protein
MKNLRSVFFVLAVLMLATAARAQQQTVKADVPFDFVVGDRAYPAGEYTVKSALENTGILRLDNIQESIAAFVPSDKCENRAPSKNTKLVFRRMAGRYFLYQVWTEGSLTGREFPKSRIETELAQNHESPEVVIVAAMISR